MAWWGHNLLLRASAEEEETKRRGDSSADLTESVKDIIYNSFLSSLYFLLSILTYGYLFFLIFIFFFQNDSVASRIFLKLAESVAEPYLGLIGVYLFVKEIRRRRGFGRKGFGEIFVALWLLLFFISSFLVFFSQKYHFGPVYNLILTNSLATIIIRLGTVLHF